ncbi:hypothetical protein Vqi01_01690 [Micromonospora qiuiae]|uniref:Uncharacterized protein n=1 Tax=Micromonospora qiuiae TaxID=502268 RepID=A0ABQ4J4H0_9ACTN|nr:hypothetical protein [Micromonospora qiuiae]GIJ25007.1 hypothetical protein Vqi01_01690 [Micromonospora qiuiae]
MNVTRTTTDIGTDVLPTTRRFDPSRHRRITGLFDLWLEPGVRGGLVVPQKPDRPLTARAIIDLIQRSGEPANDVRILTADGARYTELFSEVAGMLAHDVLVSPDGAVIRHHDRQAGNRPLHAIPLDRKTRRVKDWLVIQPPDLATPLPGWFTVDRGLVRPRTGLVGLPLRGGLVLATRADFVTRRATAHRLGAAPEGLVTVAVTARAGGFLVGDYDGTQRVCTGYELAALLGNLPLYGCELRLWLTWPSDPDEQRSLGKHTQELAETTGATVWTPPPGGSAELVDSRQDLRALDYAGQPAPWQAHRPRFSLGPPALHATPAGLLVPMSDQLSITAGTTSPPGADTAQPDQPAEALPVDASEQAEPAERVTAAEQAKPEPAEAADPDGTAEPEKPAAATKPAKSAVAERGEPADLPVTPFPRPALVAEKHRTAYGPAWLSAGQQVNAERFEAFVGLPAGAGPIAAGLASAELFLLAFLDPRSVPEGGRLLRVRVEPGGAIPMEVIRDLPARLQHLQGLREAYLLPAARLDRIFAVDTFDVDRAGNLTAVSTCEGESLRIRCASPARSIAGLSNEVRRWPTFGTRRAYALLSAERPRLPRTWLRLYRNQPPVQPGRLLLEVRIPRGRAIDVMATADLLAPLTRVQSQAERLRTAQVELIVRSRSYQRVRVHRAYRADGGVWQRVGRLSTGPLPAVLPQLQTPAPQDPAPQVPAPQDPAPQVPAPQVPAPQDPAPQDPAPQVPAAQVPTPS